MNMNQFLRSPRHQRRRGVFIVLAAIVMAVLFAFLSFGIDTGLIALEQTRLQNGVDAASLAASQEITSAVQAASEDGSDPNSVSISHAKEMAVQVAEANGVYIDPDRDVEFGKRTYDSASDSWSIAWGASPVNVVQVTAHRDQPDVSARDGAVALAFGWAVGKPTVELQASATAFVEARDMVVVLDFSGSMNDDSQYKAMNHFDKTDIEDNMRDIFDAMNPNVGDLSFDQKYLTIVGAPPANSSLSQNVVTFKDREVYVETTKKLKKVKLKTSDNKYKTYKVSGNKTSGTYSYKGKKIVSVWVKAGSASGSGERFNDNNTNVKKAFGLNNVSYPFKRGSWDDYINYCRDNSTLGNAGTRQMYGRYNFVNYCLDRKYHFWETEDLWKAPHYPFHAVKNGFSLFLDFLEDLDFGDEIGIVSYDENSRVEDELDMDGEYASLNGNLISDDYDTVDAIQRHRQAGHYGSYTAVGFGVKEASDLLTDHARHGARPTMVLMTDGQANRHKDGFNLPADWDWAEYTDYDGDGDADYSTSNRSKQYAFWEAIEANKKGCTIHTMSVGANSDRSLMTAIAFACGGIHISVPGGSTIAEMEEQMLGAFSVIAARIPPPQLVYDLEPDTN